MTISSSSQTVGNTVYLTSRDSLCSSWNGFNDTETSIEHYHFAMCLENDDNTCIIPYRDLNNRTSICVEDAPVIDGEKYFIKIEATNQVGLSSMAESTRFIVDTTEPSIGDITASNPLGGRFGFISAELLAQWDGFVDLESGIMEYFVCVGTAPGLCDTVELVSAGNISRHTWSNLNLTHNEEYFVSIKALNKADLFTNFTSSDPVTVDKTGKLYRLTYSIVI